MQMCGLRGHPLYDRVGSVAYPTANLASNRLLRGTGLLGQSLVDTSQMIEYLLGFLTHSVYKWKFSHIRKEASHH